MFKKAIVIMCLVGIGFFVGQSYSPSPAKAGSVDQLISEVRALRRAVEGIDRTLKFECR